jgi:hypothetical protein
MLHIHNGDSSAETAKQSSLAGEQLVWRESLITGPTPSGLSADEWRRIRARHLSESYGVDCNECIRDLLTQEQTLASFSEHDEVILWFEYDLFCQLHLLYLLNWFSQRDLGTTKLSLICIGDFPGKENFRGLGELNAEQLASLFPTRQQVTFQQLNLATQAWHAYCSSDPGDIKRVLQADTSPLPFLRGALEAHLKRFPSTRNGLGRVENRALELIHSGVKRFSELFLGFGDGESVYGMGDAQFWLALSRLSKTVQPLLKITNTPNGEMIPASDGIRKAEFEITDPGEAVLKGRADFVALNGIELWLGGVYLSSDKNIWRWDDEKEGLVQEWVWSRDGTERSQG